MIKSARLDNLQQCCDAVIRDRMPGDLIETGVWRGGGLHLMPAILSAYGVKDRVSGWPTLSQACHWRL
jgi:Macrocin-O-methyltransferase (TylF)